MHAQTDAETEKPAGSPIDVARGQRLADAHAASSLTAIALARAGRVNKSTLYRHKAGLSGMRASTASSYAAALGVTPEWLLFGSAMLSDATPSLADVLFAGMAERGHHFEGFTAERAVFHLIDRLSARIIELEQRGHRPDGRRLEVVR